MAEIGGRHAGLAHPQDHRGAGQPRRTGGPVRASGARIGRGPVPLSATKERDHGAQHAGDDLARAAVGSGSTDYSRHDRGVGEEQISGESVTVLPYAGFALVALAAIGFATFAVWRGRSKGKVL